jgi:hypothetical protein
MSKEHIVPARPKPGRKPQSYTSMTRRADQNRKAQAKHRETKREREQQLLDQIAKQDTELREKAMRIHQLEEGLRQVRETCVREHGHMMQAQQPYAHQMHIQQGAHQNMPSDSPPTPPFRFAPPPIGHLLNARPELMRPLPGHHFMPHQRAEVAAFSPASSSDACERCTPEHCACVEDVFVHPVMRGGGGDDEEVTVREQDHSAHEIDFTTHGTATDTCGFCDDPGNYCPCKDGSRTNGGEESSSAQRSTVTSVPIATGPGSCSDCQVDPKKRKWCQTFSRLRNEITPPDSRRSSANGDCLRTIEPKIESSIDKLTSNFSTFPGMQSIGCSETYKLLDGRVPLDNDAMDWRQLKPMLPQRKLQDDRRDTVMSMEPGRYSAMEVDVGSILATLSNSRRPLEPRPSDGSMAPLVEQAEKLRRNSVSPLSHGSDSVSEINKAA